MTLLAQDGVEGLQARARDGAWIDVPPEEGAATFVIVGSGMPGSGRSYRTGAGERTVRRSALVCPGAIAIGQDEAVRAVANAVRRARAGLPDQKGNTIASYGFRQPLRGIKPWFATGSC